MVVQAIIDIIKEIIHGQLGCFNRGDPAAWDFQVGDFVQDNTWRDLDLSGFIPETTQAVLLRLVIRTTVSDTAVNFRTKGNANIFNLTRTACPVANVRNSVDIIVHPDANRFIQYKLLAPAFNLCNVCIAGWWLR